MWSRPSGQQVDASAGATGDRLRRALESARFPLSAVHRRELRQRVCDHVDALKANGLEPEQVILAVKRIAREAGLQPASNAALVHSRMSATDELLVELVGWCIEQYFGCRGPAR